jgi:hypothetical protein
MVTVADERQRKEKRMARTWVDPLMNELLSVAEAEFYGDTGGDKKSMASAV